MKSSRLGDIVFIFCVAASLYSCDTASTVENPNKNYFIKYYGGDGDQEGVDAVIATDGSIYLFGNSTPRVATVGKQLYLVKTDAEGKLIWEKTFGGQYDEEAKDIELTADNRLVVLANSKKGSLENDILLMTFTLDGVKIDSTLLGMKTILGTEANDEAATVSQTSDGFIVSGFTTGVSVKPNQGSEDVQDALHIRFTNSLVPFDNTIWKSVSGSIGSDGTTRVYQVNATTYYVFGYTNIDVAGTSTIDFNFWVYQLGATGESNNSKMYPGVSVTDEKLTSAIVSPVTSGDGFLLAGTRSDASGNYDIYVNKLRKTLTFNEAVDYQFSSQLSDLGINLDKAMVSVFPSSFPEGYLILATDNRSGKNNFSLTKIDNQGNVDLAWSEPLIFGGQNDDYIGAVAELSDGKIILLGTMSIGDDLQKKMAMIKVNKEGKFAN
jgi:hypothetical protein